MHAFACIYYLCVCVCVSMCVQMNCFCFWSKYLFTSAITKV